MQGYRTKTGLPIEEFGQPNLMVEQMKGLFNIASKAKCASCGEDLIKEFKNRIGEKVCLGCRDAEENAIDLEIGIGRGK